MQHSSVIPYVSPWSFGWQNRWTNAERYNSALQKAFKLGQWFPLFGLQDHSENSFDHGYAVDCSQTFAPEDRLPTRWGELPSTAFMLSFDLTEGISEWGSVAVLGMATNPTVYASQDSLYLAAPNNWWRDTAIHRFDISDPLEPTYFGGAIVSGQLLSQWSLSEHDGFLRVATTHWDRWPTVSSVTVLEAVARRVRRRRGVRPHGFVAAGGTGLRTGRNREHLRGALRRRCRLRRHLPPGRPALRARSLRSDRPEAGRRAEDSRLLALPASAQRRAAARNRTRRRSSTPAGNAACKRRSSTSPTRPIQPRFRYCRWATTPTARSRPITEPSATSPASPGFRSVPTTTGCARITTAPSSASG